MNLGQAIELLKQGQLITREGWNKKGMYLTISKFVPNNDIESDVPMNITLCNNNKLFVGWNPSQSDLFADDYKIYTKLINNNKSDNLDFNTALEYVNEGFRVARKGWNGKKQYIFKISSTNFAINTIKSLEKLSGESMIPYVYDSMGFVDGNTIQVGWIATNTDMLSDDWYIIFNKESKSISDLDNSKNTISNKQKEYHEYLEE